MAQDFGQVKSLITKAQEILVLMPKDPGPDTIASALSLHLALLRLNKMSHIACDTVLDFQEYPLREAQQIKQSIGNKNFVISFKIENREGVDKVSYNLDEEKNIFNLIISPKKGAVPLSAETVSYALSGVQADLIVMVGATSLDEIGGLYMAEPNLFTEVPTMAINRLELPVNFATHHLSQTQASCLAEYMTEVIQGLGLELDSDSATNLLAAIDVVTDKLVAPSVTALTFEAMAVLMKAGGTRIMLTTAKNSVPVEDTVVVNEDVPKEWLAPKIYNS